MRFKSTVKITVIRRRELANIDLDKGIFYSLEGMPITEMTLEILKIKRYVDAKNITKKDIQMS